MRRHRILLCVIVLAVGCFPLSVASAQADMVPFKGSFVGDVVTGGGPPGGCDENDIPRTLQLSGQATPLGTSTYTGDHCFVAEDLASFQSPGDAVAFVGGVGPWIAENGDELYCTYQGTLFPITLNPDEGGPKGLFTVVMEVTGGTGQFEGAGGVIYGAGYSSPGEGGLTASFDGTILSVGIAVAVEEEHIEASPGRFSLGQNVPNPFNPTTTIAYDLPQASDVTLTLYTITGQKVAVLVDAHQQAGRHRFRFDGSGFGNGVYLYRLEAEGFVETRRMILLE